MKSIIAMGVTAVSAALVGCNSGSSLTGARETTGAAETSSGPVSESILPDGGACPNIYYERDKLLSNGVTVTWRSSFGGFDYTLGDDYTVTEEWSVDHGSADFVTFGPRNRGHTFTPRGRVPVEGTFTHGTPGQTSVGATVNLSQMHRTVSPDFQGEIGNAHVRLVLDVDDGQGNVVRAKLGVNFHLEDPDKGVDDRCPE